MLITNIINKAKRYVVNEQYPIKVNHTMKKESNEHSVEATESLESNKYPITVNHTMKKESNEHSVEATESLESNKQTTISQISSSESFAFAVDHNMKEELNKKSAEKNESLQLSRNAAFETQTMGASIYSFLCRIINKAKSIVIESLTTDEPSTSYNDKQESENSVEVNESVQPSKQIIISKKSSSGSTALQVEEINKTAVSDTKTVDFHSWLRNFTPSFMMFAKLDGTDQAGIELRNTAKFASVDGSKALLLDGKDAYALISPKPVYFDKLSFTIGIFIKLNSVDKKQVIVGDWTEPRVIRIEISSDNSIGIVMKNINGDNLFLTSPDKSVEAGRWYKLCFTWNYFRRRLAIWRDSKKLAEGLNMIGSSNADLLGPDVMPNPPPDEHKIMLNCHFNWELGFNRDSNDCHFHGYMRNLFFILEDIPSDDQMKTLLK